MNVIRQTKTVGKPQMRFTRADQGTVFEAGIKQRSLFLVAYNGIINLDDPGRTFSFSRPIDYYTFKNVTFPVVEVVVKS